jgi:hypothetical protein
MTPDAAGVMVRHVVGVVGLFGVTGAGFGTAGGKFGTAKARFA